MLYCYGDKDGEYDECNFVAFSNNRDETNKVDDFGVSNELKMRLTGSDEKLFDVKWSGQRGAIATNFNIYIVNEHLHKLNTLKLKTEVNSLAWLGPYSLLFSDERHVSYMTVS